MLKILSLSEIFPVYLLDGLYLSSAGGGQKYCMFGWLGGHRKLITIFSEIFWQYCPLAPQI